MACKHHEQLSDGNTFDVLHRVRDFNQTATIIAECVDDVNRNRLQQAGANIILRPIRAPGSEKIIEQMFNNKDNKYQRVEVVINNKEWANIVYSLVKSNVGIAVAYISNTNEVHCNPKGEDKITAQGLIIITENILENESINNILNTLSD
ncbi:MAG: hypothetical protein QM487_13620 [Candidatus Marithrix sp.]